MGRYTHVESDKNGFSILRFSVFFQRFGPNKEYKNVKIIVIVESHSPKLLRGDLSGFGNGFLGLGGGGGGGCWRVRKSDGVPEHKNQEQVHECYEERGHRIPESLYSPQKL
jgi:hypothetical protein